MCFAIIELFSSLAQNKEKHLQISISFIRFDGENTVNHIVRTPETLGVNNKVTIYLQLHLLQVIPPMEKWYSYEEISEYFLCFGYPTQQQRRTPTHDGIPHTQTSHLIEKQLSNNYLNVHFTASTVTRHPRRYSAN